MVGPAGEIVDEKKTRSLSRWMLVVFTLTALFADVTGQSGVHCNNLTRFACNDGICISKARACDGYRDCEAGEDEFDCDSTSGTAASHVQLYKVFGGFDARRNAWPWHVLITRKGNTPDLTLSKSHLLGGGSLLNNKWVLTAAHLLLLSTPSSLVISMGVSEQPLLGEKISKNVQMFAPAAEYVHTDYSTTTEANDIALIKIGAKYSLSMMLQDGTSGVAFSYNVKPVYLPCTSDLENDHWRQNSMNVVNNQYVESCLLKEKRFVRGTDVVVTGFGDRPTDDWHASRKVKTIKPSRRLQQATLILGNEETCRNGISKINNKTGHRTKFFYPEKLLCTTSSTAAACGGDGGGPLVREMNIAPGDLRWVQIGIFSFGLECDASNPGYYTNVSRYINWINETIERDYERIQRATMNRKISKLSSEFKDIRHRSLTDILKAYNKDLKIGRNETRKTLSRDQGSTYCDSLTRFTCNDGTCFSKARVCDGYRDCEAGEDELDCDLHTRCYGRNRRMANLNKYKCGKQCISDSDCKSRKKKCKCDDECGLSCVTTGVECIKKLPKVSNSVGYEIHRRTPGNSAITSIKGRPYYVGDVVKYQCKYGMKLVGPLPRCNVKGRWSREIPKCIKNPLMKGFDVRQTYRVFGGTDAPENAWPWQVLITRKGDSPAQTLSDRNMCGGGSLLNKKWVLTAAHLFLCNTTSSLVISIGVSKRPLPGEKISKSIQMFTPAAKYVHANFLNSDGLNDIALLKIGKRFDSSMILQDDASGVTFSSNVKPVYLPCTSDNDHDFENSNHVVNNRFIEKCIIKEKRLVRGTDVVVTGFGNTNKWDGHSLPIRNPSRLLQQATLTIGNEEKCQKGIRDINNEANTKFLYSEKILCAISKRSDACIGDSGGPLVRKMRSTSGHSRWVQIGIVSYGLGCAASYPGFYTNVARYINWINKTIEQDNGKIRRDNMNRKLTKLSSVFKDVQDKLASIRKLETRNKYLEEVLTDIKKTRGQGLCNNLTRFSCKDGICFSKARLCDGYRDCAAGEDELDCDLQARCYGRNRRMANLNKYKCGKQCIWDSDCKSNKTTCKCDDECGLSCITKGVGCTKKPPILTNSIGYKIHRRTLGEVVISSIKDGPYFVGDVVKYQCKKGMKLAGPLPRCNGKGRWSREIPRCIINEPTDNTTVSHEQLYKVSDEIDAPENNWPWQVLITEKGNTPEQTLSNSYLRGGGSLLNKKWVLTAAHLFLSAPLSSLVISVGVSERPLPAEKISTNVQMFTPAAEYVHADYLLKTGLNDIALLKIGARFDSSMALQDDINGVTFSTNVKPVYLPCTSGHSSDHENSMNVVNNQFIERCLSKEKRLFRGKVVVTGFGHIDKYDFNGSLSTIHPSKYLQQVSLSLGNKKMCRKGITDINKKTSPRTRVLYSEKLLCTISNTEGACTGDSGGPLVRNVLLGNSTRWVQIGVVSYGFGCGAGNPGYHTNVARYINWINETIERDNERIQEANMDREISKLSSVLENIQNRLPEIGELETNNTDRRKAVDYLENCEILYGNKCFLPIFDEKVHKDKAEIICTKLGGKLADIYDENHFRSMWDALQTSQRDGRFDVRFWLGMTYNATTEGVFLSDGTKAKYASWLGGYPKNEPDLDSVLLEVFRRPSNDVTLSMWNVGVSEINNPLCEINNFSK